VCQLLLNALIDEKICILHFQKFMSRDEKSGVDRDKSVPYLLKNNKKRLFEENYYFPKT